MAPDTDDPAAAPATAAPSSAAASPAAAPPAAAASALTGKQRRHLRGLGHHLHAVVQIGHEGLTPALVQQTTAQLAAHELIKVKLTDTAPVDRHEAAEALGRDTGSAVAQVLGRTILLYKARKKNPAIKLP